ncbi:MAG: class SAM-dependent methyltransferase [Alphaproteobacteria bacterium]|nr:class SAM-dependent methyltransferase [Alphaproteobacteria bacterium]
MLGENQGTTRGDGMWLLDKMLAGYVKKGELTVVTHDGRTYRYGFPDPQFAPVTVRCAGWPLGAFKLSAGGQDDPAKAGRIGLRAVIFQPLRGNGYGVEQEILA